MLHRSGHIPPCLAERILLDYIFRGAIPRCTRVADQFISGEHCIEATGCLEAHAKVLLSGPPSSDMREIRTSGEVVNEL